MAAWWEILGVERDADLRAIKRSYAAKLKSIRQDENPAQFMELREAYDHALWQVKNAAQEPDYDLPEIDAVTSNAEEAGSFYEVPGWQAEGMALLGKLHALALQSDARNIPANWQEIFAELDTFGLDAVNYVRENFLDYLLTLHQCSHNEKPVIFTREVGVVIFKQMDWLNPNNQLVDHNSFENELWLGEKMGLRIHYHLLNREAPKPLRKRLFTFGRIAFFALIMFATLTFFGEIMAQSPTRKYVVFFAISSVLLISAFVVDVCMAVQNLHREEIAITLPWFRFFIIAYWISIPGLVLLYIWTFFL